MAFASSFSAPCCSGVLLTAAVKIWMLQGLHAICDRYQLQLAVNINKYIELFD